MTAIAVHPGRAGSTHLAELPKPSLDQIHSDHIVQSFVLGNKVVVGSVNAARVDFEQGVSDLVMATSTSVCGSTRWPPSSTACR